MADADVSELKEFTEENAEELENLNKNEKALDDLTGTQGQESAAAQKQVQELTEGQLKITNALFKKAGYTGEPFATEDEAVEYLKQIEGWDPAGPAPPYMDPVQIKVNKMTQTAAIEVKKAIDKLPNKLDTLKEIGNKYYRYEYMFHSLFIHVLI